MVSIFCRRVRKARQYPRVIYIPRELTSRSSTNLDRHCATPDEATRGFIGTVFIRTIFFEFWRKRKKRRRRKKWKRKFESTIGGLTPAHGGRFENGLWRGFSLLFESDKGYASVCRRCAAIYLICRKQRKARDERERSSWRRPGISAPRTGLFCPFKTRVFPVGRWQTSLASLLFTSSFFPLRREVTGFISNLAILYTHIYIYKSWNTFIVRGLGKLQRVPGKTVVRKRESKNEEEVSLLPLCPFPIFLTSEKIN